MRNIKVDGKITDKKPKHTQDWIKFHMACTSEFRKQRAKQRVRNKIAKASRKINQHSK